MALPVPCRLKMQLWSCCAATVPASTCQASLMQADALPAAVLESLCRCHVSPPLDSTPFQASCGTQTWLWCTELCCHTTATLAWLRLGPAANQLPLLLSWPRQRRCRRSWLLSKSWQQRGCRRLPLLLLLSPLRPRPLLRLCWVCLKRQLQPSGMQGSCRPDVRPALLAPLPPPPSHHHQSRRSFGRPRCRR